MARPRSEERRSAILDAATRVIAAEGLSASTAAIAKEAGVSNGSLFIYFDTKLALVNELYVQLKTGMGAAAIDGMPADADIREQFLHMWNQWMNWATSFPEKRRALAHLEVAEEISDESHATIHVALDGIAQLLERARANGPMRDASLEFVLNVTSAVADTTIDSILRDPSQAAGNSQISFDAMWRMLA